MKSRILRVYADTSVFCGICDEEFEQASRAFFRQVQSGRFRLVTSVVVQNEIETAPAQVRELFEKILGIAGIVNLTESVLQLQQAYLDAAIVTPTLAIDALHVAMATVSECSALVSWDFKHIVHFKKIRLYNAINLLEGYSQIAIYSPLQVIPYEDEQEI